MTPKPVSLRYRARIILDRIMGSNPLRDIDVLCCPV